MLNFTRNLHKVLALTIICTFISPLVCFQMANAQDTLSVENKDKSLKDVPFKYTTKLENEKVSSEMVDEENNLIMEDKSATINVGTLWNDTNGDVINAHGGGLIKVGDTYYLFGESRHSKQGEKINYVACYSSKNLVDWTFKNYVLTSKGADDLLTANIERPKVLYNEKTKKYIMWMHKESKQNYSEARAAIAYCDTVDGNYTYVKSFRPLDNMSRDCTLFKDDDGTAYFLSAAKNNADLIVYRLTDDYLGIDNQITTLWEGKYREAPAVVKKDGLYYLFTSGCTGWAPNQQKYATAESMAGPWSDLKVIGDSTCFDSQTNYVLPIQGSKTTSYVFCADRWKSDNLTDSRYIWLPLSLKSGDANIEFTDSWSVDVNTGIIKYPPKSVIETDLEQLLQNSTIKKGENTDCTIDREVNSYNKSIKLIDKSNYENVELKKVFSWRSGRFAVEWRWKASSDGISLKLQDGNETAIEIGLENSHLVYLNSDGKRNDITQIATDTWYTVKLEVDTDNKKYDVYVNGVLTMPNCNFVLPVTGFDCISFASSKDKTIEAWISNISVRDGGNAYNVSVPISEDAIVDYKKGTVLKANAEPIVTIKDHPTEGHTGYLMKFKLPNIDREAIDKARLVVYGRHKNNINRVSLADVNDKVWQNGANVGELIGKKSISADYMNKTMSFKAFDITSYIKEHIGNDISVVFNTSGGMLTEIATKNSPEFVARLELSSPYYGQFKRESETDMGIAQQNEDAMKWYRDAKLGMFIHWGIYSVAGRGEWLLENEAMSQEEYNKVAFNKDGNDYFDAANFDANLWANIAKDSGMKYTNLTTRHHDGFALFNSKHPNSFTSQQTLGRDLIAEYTKGIRNNGLRVGYYFSPINWRYPGYYDIYGDFASPTNKWKYKTDPKHKANAALMKSEIYTQVQELMANYGTVDHIFWDGGWIGQVGGDEDGRYFWESGKYQDPNNEWGGNYGPVEDGKSLGLMGVVKKYQPAVISNTRIGWLGDYKSSEGGSEVKGAIRPYAWEKCLNLNKSSWGYNKAQNLMTYSEIINMFINCVIRDGNMLINVGPDRHGVIPPTHAKLLKDVGSWTKVVQDGIYGTRGGPWNPVDGKYGFTYKGNKIFIHILKDYSENSITIPSPLKNVLKCYDLFTGKGLDFVQAKDGSVTIKGIDRTTNPDDTIIAVELDGLARLMEMTWTAGDATLLNTKLVSNALEFVEDDDASAQWKIYVPSKGVYGIDFKYALNTGNRSMLLEVNGVDIGTVDFTESTSWDKFIDKNINIKLNYGTNTIKLKTFGLRGARIEKMTVAFNPNQTADVFEPVKQFARPIQKEVIFKEDFEQGIFDTTRGMDDSWRIVSGNAMWMFPQSPDKKSLWKCADGNPFLVYGEQEMADYSVQASIKLDKCKDLAGVVARYSDNNNFYMFGYNQASGRLELAKYIDGVKTVIASEDFRNTASWQVYKLELIKDGLKGYVNGELILTARDASFNAGKAGFGTQSGNLKVDEISILK